MSVPVAGHDWRSIDHALDSHTVQALIVSLRPSPLQVPQQMRQSHESGITSNDSQGSIFLLHHVSFLQYGTGGSSLIFGVFSAPREKTIALLDEVSRLFVYFSHQHASYSDIHP